MTIKINKGAFLGLLIFFMIGCKSANQPVVTNSRTPNFSKEDVVSAQKVLGLEFSESAIDTMFNYLGGNQRGYDAMKKIPVDNETFPALLFDTHPMGFIAPKPGSKPVWNIPDNVAMPDDIEALAFYTIPQIASLIKNKKVKSEDLTKMFINRIKKYDGELQSVITLTEERALTSARKADADIANGNYKGILHGIPYGVKDLMAVDGYPTTWGAKPYEDQQINYTSTVVQKLDDAGAILIAKLVSGALARGDVWFNGKTKNPWDITQGASGSSAGPGSATSAGLVVFSLGTETLGSITSPSTRNGITGLRPTYGRVSRHGVMSLSWSMDKIGPMARNAEDCAIVFDVINGDDPKDPSTSDFGFSFRESRDVKTLKVGYLKNLVDRDTSNSGDNLRQALEEMKAMGIEPVEIELPKEFPFAAFDIILRAEAGTFFDQLVREKGVDTMVEQTSRSRANSLRQARFIPAVEYLQANRHRRRLINEMYVIMKDLDVLISPTSGGNQSFITNLTGHPVISVPTGLDDKQRPTSLTIIGNLYDEEAILLLAKAFQERTDFDELHPPNYLPGK
jgi:Asp-tRNA(Asn)/Glu-tRNA(Gln) amidotransferase A subunit family amidase